MAAPAPLEPMTAIMPAAARFRSVSRGTPAGFVDQPISALLIMVNDADVRIMLPFPRRISPTEDDPPATTMALVKMAHGRPEAEAPILGVPSGLKSNAPASVSACVVLSNVSPAS